MAKNLTSQEIRALYGIKPGQDLVAFGRAVKNNIAHVVRRRGVEIGDFQCMADFWRAKDEQDAEQARRAARRATPVIESQVSELF